MTTRIARLLLSIVFCVMASGLSLGDGQSTVRLSVIDVGQGDSIFIEGPDGYAVLVDSGPATDCPIAFLNSQRVTHLNTVVLTHPDADHVGCMATVLNAFPTGAVVHNGQAGTSASYDAFASTVAAQAIPTVIARAGQVLTWGCCVTATVLNPISLTGSANNNSVVLRVNYGNAHVLLTGDIETQSENAIMGRTSDLASQLLKVAHHGSDSSSSPAFLSAVHPAYAAISVGAGNRYDHPAQETLDHLANVGAAVYRTDEQGTLRFTVDGQTVRPADQFPYTVFLPVIVSEPPLPTRTPTLTPTPSETALPVVTPTETRVPEYTVTATQTRMPEATPTLTSTPTPPVMRGYNVQCQQAGSVQICASVSSATPAQFSTVTVYGRLLVGGSGQAGQTMTTTWHYKSSTPTGGGTTNADGLAQYSRGISGASKGYQVNVDVAIAGYQATTWFTPQ